MECHKCGEEIKLGQTCYGVIIGIIEGNPITEIEGFTPYENEGFTSLYGDCIFPTE